MGKKPPLYFLLKTDTLLLCYEAILNEVIASAGPLLQRHKNVYNNVGFFAPENTTVHYRDIFLQLLALQ